jgi:hypothetical protein
MTATVKRRTSGMESKAAVLASQSDVSFGSHSRHCWTIGKREECLYHRGFQFRRCKACRWKPFTDCPTGKSVNCLSSPLCKNIPLRICPKSNLELSPSRPLAGASAIVTNVGMGCGGRGSVRRCQGMAGRVSRELTNGTRTNGANADGKAVWFWHPLLVLNSRRQVGPTGLGTSLQSADDGDKTNSSPGRARNKP